jgi:hypothetical protein
MCVILVRPSGIKEKVVRKHKKNSSRIGPMISVLINVLNVQYQLRKMMAAVICHVQVVAIGGAGYVVYL